MKTFATEGAPCSGGPAPADQRITAAEGLALPRPEFRWPIAVEAVISATRDELWSMIATPGIVGMVHPFCERNPVDSWSGVGSTDQVHYYNGLYIERRIAEWYDGLGYDLEVHVPRADTNLFVAWRVRDADDGRGALSIAIYPEALQRIPVVLRWLPHHAWLRPGFRSYLRSVLRGFDYHARTGEKVTRNQFGPHRWFSR